MRGNYLQYSGDWRRWVRVFFSRWWRSKRSQVPNAGPGTSTLLAPRTCTTRGVFCLDFGLHQLFKSDLLGCLAHMLFVSFIFFAYSLVVCFSFRQEFSILLVGFI